MARRTPWISKLILVGVLLVSLLGGLREITALEVGEKAPDFTLSSTMGGQISLSQFQGKQFVFIEFYGVDFAPTCAANLSARKADYSKFQALNVQILRSARTIVLRRKCLQSRSNCPTRSQRLPDLRVTRQYGGLSSTPRCPRSGSPSGPSS
jgi:peroxiredoxin Q/BCP